MLLDLDPEFSVINYIFFRDFELLCYKQIPYPQPLFLIFPIVYLVCFTQNHKYIILILQDS